MSGEAGSEVGSRDGRRVGRPAVAAFDFDGTLTRHDTLVPFLQRLCGARAVSAALVGQLGHLVRGMPAGRERDGYKAAVLARLLAGWRLDAVEAVVAAHAESVIAAQLRSVTLERVEWHRRRGHHLVVVSASPEIYVGPVARQLGFDAVLATRLEVVDGVLTGRLSGANVRGAEKVRRLHEHLRSPDPRHGRVGAGDLEVWAYGDSAGDRELLAAANVAVRVTRRGLRATRRDAAASE